MTNYLGTGYSFGIHRLAETFSPKAKIPRPVHVLIISDSDMFTVLEQKGSGRVGWDVARETASLCGGGATYVLQIAGGANILNSNAGYKFLDMKSSGWNVHLVDSMDELLVFARQFSQSKYGVMR